MDEGTVVACWVNRAICLLCELKVSGVLASDVRTGRNRSFSQKYFMLASLQTYWMKSAATAGFFEVFDTDSRLPPRSDAAETSRGM